MEELLRFQLTNLHHLKSLYKLNILMSKKTVTELYNIAKDALSIIEYITNNQYVIEDNSSKRLESITGYLNKMKEAAEMQKLWENASAGATSSGAIASVAGNFAAQPIRRMDEYGKTGKKVGMKKVDKHGQPIKENVKEGSGLKAAGLALGTVAAMGAGVVGQHYDDDNSIVINGQQYEHVEDIGGNIPFKQYTKIIKLGNKFVLTWSDNAGSLRGPRTKQKFFTWCDKQGNPLPRAQNKNGNYSQKGYKIQEDVGTIGPVTPDEETNLNNIKNTIGSKYSGTQIGAAINKASSGAQLTSTDQKVLSPLIQGLDNVMQDSNSANQFKSTVSRAGGVAAGKAAVDKQAQAAQAQKTGTAAQTSPQSGQLSGLAQAAQGTTPTLGQMQVQSNKQAAGQAPAPSSPTTSNSATGTVGTTPPGGSTNIDPMNTNQNAINAKKLNSGVNTESTKRNKKPITEKSMMKDYLSFKGKQ